MGKDLREQIERALDAATHYQPRVSRWAPTAERQRVLNRAVEAAQLIFRAARTIADPKALPVNVSVSERIIDAAYVALFGVTLRKAAAMGLVDAVEFAASEVMAGAPPDSAVARARNTHLATEQAAPSLEVFRAAVDAWVAAERAARQRPRRGRVPDKWRRVATALDSAGLRYALSVKTVAREWKGWKKKRTIAAVLERHRPREKTP